MAHIVTTIPKSKYDTWKECEKILSRCQGEADGRGWYWLVNMTHLPTKLSRDPVCYMIYDGKIRGYFHIHDTDLSENWRSKHDIGKPRTTKCLVLTDWHPIPPLEMRGFQGWRYTQLNPYL